MPAGHAGVTAPSLPSPVVASPAPPPSSEALLVELDELLELEESLAELLLPELDDCDPAELLVALPLLEEVGLDVLALVGTLLDVLALL